MPNKSKLNADRQKRITDALRSGNTRGIAATHGGITHATMLTWLHKGEAAKQGKHFEFLEAIREAEKDAEMGRVATILRASIGGELISRTTTMNQKTGVVKVEETYTRPEWTAAAWGLERKNPNAWGRRDRLTIEYEGALHQQRQAVEVLLAMMRRVLTPEQWEELGGLVRSVRAPVAALEEHLGSNDG